MADASISAAEPREPEPNFEANVDAWEAAEDASARRRPWSSAWTVSRARSTCCWRWRARRRWTLPRSPSWHWPISIWPSSPQALKLRLELAADYLVMAAWLAYLKSQLLLPREAGTEDQPSGDELAARLAFRLKRLEAMRNAAATPDDPQAPRAATSSPAACRRACAPSACGSIPPSSTTCSRPTPSSAGARPSACTSSRGARCGRSRRRASAWRRWSAN